MHEGRDLVFPCAVPRWNRVVSLSRAPQPCLGRGRSRRVSIYHIWTFPGMAASMVERAPGIHDPSSIPHRPHPSSVRLSHTTSVLNTPTMWSERRMQAFSHTSHGTTKRRRLAHPVRFVAMQIQGSDPAAMFWWACTPYPPPSPTHGLTTGSGQQ
jgi:hypothetical protein